MIYILIISLLIKKPFYLLRRQSFSFEIVSEFSNFMSRGWGFWLPVLSRGKGFCTQLLSRGEGFCSLRVVSRGFVPGGWFWMKLIPALLLKLLAKNLETGGKHPPSLYRIKFTSSSLLIHAFAYSLFVGVYSVISNMTRHSHSCHLIKLIHCRAPERDVLSDERCCQRWLIVFISCFASLLY